MVAIGSKEIDCGQGACLSRSSIMRYSGEEAWRPQSTQISRLSHDRFHLLRTSWIRDVSGRHEGGRENSLLGQEDISREAGRCTQIQQSSLGRHVQILGFPLEGAGQYVAGVVGSDQVEQRKPVALIALEPPSPSVAMVPFPEFRCTDSSRSFLKAWVARSHTI